MGWILQVRYREPVAFCRFDDACRRAVGSVLEVPAVPPLVLENSPGHVRPKPPPPTLGPDADLWLVALEGLPSTVEVALLDIGRDVREVWFSVEVTYGSPPLCYILAAAAAAALSELSAEAVIDTAGAFSPHFESDAAAFMNAVASGGGHAGDRVAAARQVLGGQP